MRYHVLALTTLALLGGCNSVSRVDASNINEIRGLTANKHKLELSDMRYAALRDVALSVGARTGLAYRAEQINEMLERNGELLARTFNFNRLLVDKNVLPPVLIEARNTLEQASSDAIRLADRSYQIVKQARFVTAAPTWRDYLYMPHTRPEIPDATLLPKNGAEERIWKRFVEMGYEAGLKQADQIYEENLASIKRDFNGILLYRDLLERNMVSKPFVATMDLGVTGGGDSMAVGERVLRITEHPSLKASADDWTATIATHQEAKRHG